MTSKAEQLKQASRREAARRRLLRFTKHTFPGQYRVNFHHRRICEALEAVARYELTRLIIVAPPRHGKSELVSRRFPAWYLGNAPHRQIISATYGQDLSDRMSLDVKRTIESEAYTELFPDMAFGNLNRTAEWTLAAGGTYKNTGVGGPVTGFGANILLIDDPVKNREEAESDRVRDKTWEWFNNDVMTRLEQPNAVVLMATRWHEDDLIGRVLKSPTADQWTILHLGRVRGDQENPADPRPEGAPLWPGRVIMPWERCDELAAWPHNAAEAMERAAQIELNEDDVLALDAKIREPGAPTKFDPAEYAGGDPFFRDDPTISEEEKEPVALERLIARDLAAYRAFKANDPYGAAALEDGDPTPREGALLDEEDVNTYLADPQTRASHCDSVVIAIDANFKKTKTSDFAAATVFGRTKKPNALYVLDEAHGRFTYPNLKRAVKGLIDDWPNATILIEAKANGQALIDDLREAGYGRVIDFDPGQYGSKEARAQYAADFVKGGGLFVPTRQKAPFITQWLEEVTKFGQTARDDRMDTLSMACYHLTGGQPSAIDHLRRITGMTG